MSRCDEYRQQILDVEKRIRDLRANRDIWDDTAQRREIELLEQKRKSLEDKYERSLKRSGC